MSKAWIGLSLTLAALLSLGTPKAGADGVRDDVPLLEQFPADIIDGIPVGQAAPTAPPPSGVDLFPVDKGHAWGVRHHKDGSHVIFYCDAKLGHCRTMDWLPKGTQKK